MIFLSEYFIRRTTFINRILSIKHSQENLFSKMVPIFQRLSIKQSYKITWNPLGFSFKCKNLLNFTCTTKKFRNRYHTNSSAMEGLGVVKNIWSKLSGRLSPFLFALDDWTMKQLSNMSGYSSFLKVFTWKVFTPLGSSKNILDKMR